MSLNLFQRRCLGGAAVALGLLWFGLVVAHLTAFSQASMDSWCYGSPVWQSPGPGRLTAPGLGDFPPFQAGWGLHWPGGPWLLSWAAAGLPRDAGTGIGLFAGTWLLLAGLAGAVAWRAWRSAWVGAGVVALLLADRLCFSVVWLQRYELLAGALALGVCGVITDPRWRSLPAGRLGVTVALLLLPSLHPVSSLFAVGVLCWLAGQRWLGGVRDTLFWWALAAVVAGFAGFAGYYLSSPDRLALFRDHLAANVAITREHARPGGANWIPLLELYAPSFSGLPVFGLALVEVLGLVRDGWRADGKQRLAWWRDNERKVLWSLVLAGSMLAIQSTYNGYYWAMVLPFAVVLAPGGLGRITARWGGGGARVFGLVLLVLVLAQSTYLLARTWKWRQQGWVNYRAAMVRFVDALPAGGGTWYIPETLVDLGPQLAGRTLRLNTLPYNAGDALRARYHAWLADQLRPGDLLIVDTQQARPPAFDGRQSGWRRLAELDLTWRGNRGRGVGLTAYQRTGEPAE